MFWLLIASQLSLPVTTGRSGDIREIFSPDDMPAGLEKRGETRAVYSRTTVKPDGKARECIAEISSGDRELDSVTCRIIIRRTKFRPAKWSDGNAVYGVIRLPISWFVVSSEADAERLSRKVLPDLEISVSSLPKGYGDYASVTLQVAVGENGKIVDCADFAPRKLKREEINRSQLIPLACKQAALEVRMVPPLEGGVAMRSVQSLTVNFVEAK